MRRLRDRTLDSDAVSHRTLARGVVLLVVGLLVVPTVVAAVTYEPTQSAIKQGTITKPANGITVVSTQGFRNHGTVKKPARLIAFGPRGQVRWVYNGSGAGIKWFYSVDPLPNGNLLVTGDNPHGTIVTSFDPRNTSRAWTVRLPFHDTHDADLINGDELLVANMRHYNRSSGKNDERILIYNLTTHHVTWQWRFRTHGFRKKGGGPYKHDWTHVNDVDKVGPGRYLVSVRNFDQVIVVNRSTGNATMRLGSNQHHDVLFEQHNPEYLTSSSGKPTMLVADSENDRVVEYQRTANGWDQTWKLSGHLSWPRDADRLPDGNTLVVDTLNHRVVEVTPKGKVVWEVYAPWGPYDAERIPFGNEGGGPTIADQNATGNYTLHGSAGLEPGTGDSVSFAQRLTTTFAGTPLSGPVSWFATRWSHIVPWLTPVWMTGWAFAGLLGATFVLVGWGVVELFLARERVQAGLGRILS